MHAIAAFAGLPIESHEALVDVELPMPDHGPLDLLVRVEAVSVNPVDVKVRVSRSTPDSPRVLGYDGAGVVEAVGAEAPGFAPGDHVWWAGDIGRAGANADYQAVDHRIVAHMPSTWSFAEAAALPLTSLTALEAFRDHLGLDPRSTGTLLMVGGAGGVGSAAIQLAKATTGLRVLATAGREASAEWASEMGADAIVDHRTLEASVREAAPEGVDHIFSAFTPGNIGVYAAVGRPFSRVVAIDGGFEDVTPLKSKSMSLHLEYMFARALHGAADLGVQGEYLAEVAHLAERGLIRTTANELLEGFTAANMREAHRRVESSSMIGKVVVHR
ncbi:zinc-binding alcohol dehydrogenase family protein [Demequina sp. SYSU T00192]|uniref:Zinc-type alcohol dehydrogenase-like protein n=1 Tax=Demequina litoralis TaxID=3051660 RepID=A0ABT8GAW7_9MICO|nr:zinc-binding alcohol dehydrogenase family protein [Demequina sp. SYSU T00192]MDN4476271.1 zinc-binding alcohol dehydrogenase family protein [Demequina sp. SYSU T00192]